MGIVAVAGGTGGLGKTIVQQLVAGGKNRVLVLTREQPTSIVPGAEAIIVNYRNIDETAATLDANKVDTVVATMGWGAAQSQLDLIAAADKASVTKRFIPSEFGGYVSPDSTNPLRADVRHAAEALSKSNLEYTRFAVGLLMDYFGMPSIPTDLKHVVWAINIPKKCAAIPGTGDEVFAATYSKDVARYVERLIEDECAWPKYSIVSGSDVTLNQILELAEEYTGIEPCLSPVMNEQRKRFGHFDVTYDSEEKLRNNEATVVSTDSSFGEMDPKSTASMAGLMLLEGEMALPKEGRLADKYPEVKAMSIEEFMAKAWKKI